jgi:hypothetical protein
MGDSVAGFVPGFVIGEASKEVALTLLSLLRSSFGWSPQPGLMLIVALAS